MPRRRIASKAVAVIRTELLRRLRTLTPAEREVARLVCLGLSNSAIGRKRRTSVHTVARQTHAILVKLRLASRQALSAWYGIELALGRWKTLDALGLTGPGKGANAAMSASLAVGWRLLQPAQRRLLELQARGYSQGAIAKKLRLPPSTVSGVIQSVRKRLGFDSALRGTERSMAALLVSVVTAPAKIMAADEARQRVNPRPGKPPVLKRDFIRAQPASMSPLEIVAAARTAGISVTKQHVYAELAHARSRGERRAPSWRGRERRP